ncbi:MAG: hypothetical protein LBQ76_07955 [Candidatus Fibromonas sp.]|jgi:hypothetical protein|nr:hypothetical protein [Candidatus Fibromonas sp.]
MNLQLTSKTALFALGLFFCLSFAQEADVSGRQKTVISALDSIEENVIGFALNGRAKGGAFGSVLNSKALPDSADVSEYSAFSDFLLGISIRPSNETKATFDLRFHKDWQSAYREGNNSPVIRWWSYDGNILNKKLKFNLGTMRIAYTPLTLYLPEPSLIMEPEIFSDLKKEAMEERYLDGTNRRLLQGLNLEFATSAGVFDNVFLQGTIMRLRKIANAEDRIFYDFDPNKERYSTAARIGVETFGVSFGVSDVYTFSRLGSTIKVTTDSLVNFEKNNVLSFELNYNSKKLLSGPVNFGIGAEYAMSNWSYRQDRRTTTLDSILIVDAVNGAVGLPTHTPPPGITSETSTRVSYDTINRYPYYGTRSRITYEISEHRTLDNKGALLANAFVSFNSSPFEVKLSGHFLNVNKDFEAELAASPAYLPNLPILNSGANINSALGQFRTGSLESMYYSLYYSLPMNAATIIIGKTGIPDGIFTDELSKNGYLYNNYKFSQYYRNAYTQQTYTRMERRDSISLLLDPAVNLALPYGYATPDRKGGDADLSFVWNKTVSVRGVFGSYSSENGDYTRLGGGLEVDAGRLAGLSKDLVVSGSYEQNKEENGAWNPQVDRIMVGAKVGIWRGLSLIGGFQQLTKEFKNPYVIASDPEAGIIAVDKTSEILAIGGPQIKISEKAEFSLQGGLLSNSIKSSNGIKLDLDKYIASGMVTVEF